MKGCCFTGYRPEKTPFPYDEGNADYLRFENNLTKVLARALSDGFDTFYCGGAMGFDILAAELLLLMRHNGNFRLIMVLPYRSQAAAFPSEWKERYNALLKSADEVVCLSDAYPNRFFADRNEYMVERSERVISFCDGKSGGTLNTLRYARKKGLEIINVAEELKQPLNYTFFEVIEGEDND